MKNLPGTPLPWRLADEVGPNVIATDDPSLNREICECYQDGEQLEEADEKNAVYIIHASNAYPALVEALRDAMHKVSSADDCRKIQDLLVTIGEAV